MWALNCYVTIPNNIPNHVYIAPELISAIIHMFKIYNDILNNPDKYDKNLISIINDTFNKICDNENLNYFKEIEDLCSENNKIQINQKQINQEQIDEIIKNLSQYLIPIKDVVYLMKNCLDICKPAQLKKIEAIKAEERKKIEEEERKKKERWNAEKAAQQIAEKAAQQKEIEEMGKGDTLLIAKRLEEEAKRQATEKLSKEKVLKELTLQNAWNAISTNNKLDSKKIKPEKLTEIANALKDPEIHTFNNENNTYIIPDGQFDELIGKLKQKIKIVTKNGLTQYYTIMDKSELTQEDINRHKNERTDFKAKNSKFYSPTLSKLWKRGGIKTRKYKKGKKGNKYKSKKYRKNNKTKKCKTNKCKSKKRNYK